MPFDATQNPRQIAADVLRNTTKPKGQVRLFSEGRFCAIGVLGCEIFGHEPEAMAVEGSEDAGGTYEAVSKFVGVPADEIWERNDGVDGHKPHTFPEIADWLESLPE